MKETISIEDLLKQYQRYITKVAGTLTNDDYIKEELIQEANIGIWKAYQSFNETQGTLHSYLISYIRGKMLNYLTDSIRTIKPSARLIHHINRTEDEQLGKALSQLQLKFGIEQKRNKGERLGSDRIRIIKQK